jgi:hypothetical protein
MYFVSQTAQVELRSGRVQAHASGLTTLALPCTMSPMNVGSCPCRMICRPAHTLTRLMRSARRQGLTLVHFSAQL